MSWLETKAPYGAFEAASKRMNAPSGLPWSIQIWEVTDERPRGQSYTSNSPACLQTKAKLRIIYAPLDLPRQDAVQQMLDLFTTLNIPSEFTAERLQAINHSFCRRTDKDGSSSWFHYLCKNINSQQGQGHLEGINGTEKKSSWSAAALPLADYTWNQAAFFLRADNDGDVTLTCFGAGRNVRHRLEQFVDVGAWKDVQTEPYVLFDLILEGLFFEVDEVLWKMNEILGRMEKDLLHLANSKLSSKVSSELPFTALHNCSKYMAYVAEAVEACIMVVDSTALNIRQDSAADSERAFVQMQLKESLSYRRSLFRSSQLRLQSMQKRIDSSITLAFNLVTQQDSLRMIADSNVMKMIAALTMVFLPTTGVATVLGSQLFISEKRGEDWVTDMSPLFWVMWYVAIPLTVVVGVMSGFWHWYVHRSSGRDSNMRVDLKVKVLRWLAARDKRKRAKDLDLSGRSIVEYTS